MRKLLVVLLVLVFMVGCKDSPVNSHELSGDEINFGEGDISEWKCLTSEDELFKVSVYINKLKFKEDEKIEMFSIMEYIGEEKEIKTWSGFPNFKYSIYDGKDYYCMAMQHDILMPNTFKKGKEYKYPFQKAGGWESDDPKADYWESYYEEPELRLPIGTYEVQAFCDFSLDESALDDSYRQTVKFQIVVE